MLDGLCIRHCTLSIQQAVQTCVEQQAPKKQNKDQCLQSRCNDHPPIRLWILGRLPKPHKTSWAPPPTLPPHHLVHTLERLHQQTHSPGGGRQQQHRVQAVENPTTLGRAYFQDGRPSLAQDHLVWWTLFWPPKTEGQQRSVTRTHSKSPPCLPHQPSWVGYTCWRPWHLVNWWYIINKAASSLESTRRTFIEEKRQRRNNSEATTPNPDETFTCCHCNRTCQSCIGLINHERACRKCGPPSWSSFVKQSHEFGSPLLGGFKCLFLPSWVPHSIHHSKCDLTITVYSRDRETWSV